MFLAIKLILLMAVAGGAFVGGWQSRGWREDAQRLDDALAYAEAIRAEQARADQIEADTEKRLRFLRTAARNMERDTAREIEKPDYRCVLPVSGRLLLRADVRAANAARATGIADSASPAD